MPSTEKIRVLPTTVIETGLFPLEVNPPNATILPKTLAIPTDRLFAVIVVATDTSFAEIVLEIDTLLAVILPEAIMLPDEDIPTPEDDTGLDPI